MEEINFNNSLKSRNGGPSIQDISEEPHKESKKIEGAQFGKPTLGKRIKKTMGSIIADDLSQVFNDLTNRVIVPSIKSGICNTLISGVSMVFGGGKPYNGGYYGPGYTPYNNVSRATWRQPDAYDNRSAYDKYGYRRDEEVYYTRRSYNDIEIPTYEKALEAINELYRMKQYYPNQPISVSDYFGIFELTGEFTDQNWGWYDLPNNLSPTPCGNGRWSIILPKPVPIRK